MPVESAMRTEGERFTFVVNDPAKVREHGFRKIEAWLVEDELRAQLALIVEEIYLSIESNRVNETLLKDAFQDVFRINHEIFFRTKGTAPLIFRGRRPAKQTRTGATSARQGYNTSMPRFQPGQSGNPNGRPRLGNSLAERIRAKCGDDGGALVDKLYSIAMDDEQPTSCGGGRLRGRSGGGDGPRSASVLMPSALP